MARAIEASGGVTRDRPCRHFSSQELVDMSVSWTDEDGNALAEVAPTSVVVQYLAGEGASSASSLTGSSFLTDTWTSAELNPVNLSGVYRARVKLLDAAEGVYRNLPFYMSIESDDFGGGVQAVTVQGLRSFLNDRVATNTTLLAEEFTDELLVESVIAPVRAWNESVPDNWVQTTESFSSNLYWLLGAAGHLLRTTSRILLARNRLKSPGDGLDDSQRADDYARIGEQFWAEFANYVAVEKRERDVEGAFALV